MGGDVKVKIPFNRIYVNQGRRGLEVVFNYDGNWYRLDWDKVPERYKVLYVALLRLQGLEVPGYLREYERDTINVSDTSIEVDLDECEKIPESYPL